MADPRIISIDDSGIATWDTGNGSTMQTAYGGLPAAVQQQYQNQVAAEYLGRATPSAAPAPVDTGAFVQSYLAENGLGAPAPTAAPYAAAPELLDPFNRPARVSRADPDLMQLPAAQASASPAAAPRQRARRPLAAEPEAPQEGTQDAPPDSRFVDPVASMRAGAQPAQERPREGLQGLSHQDMLRIQEANPRAVLGGEPGHVQRVQGPVQRQSREASPGLPGALDRMDASKLALGQAQHAASEPLAARRAAIAAEMATQAQAADQAQAAMVQLQGERRARTAEQMGKLQRLADNHIAAEEQGIDPERYWANRSNGQRVMAGIGMILSGIGSGLAGQENMAMKIINDAIERDLLAQRENIAGKGRAVERQRGVMDDVAKMYDDEAAQTLAARALMWDASARRIAEIEAMMPNDERAAQFATLQQQIAAERAAIEVELESQLGAQVATSERDVVVGGRRGIPVGEAIKAKEASLQGAVFNPKTWVRKYRGVARSEEEARQAHKLAADANTVDGIYAEALRIRSRWGSFTNPNARAELDQLQQQALLLNKNVEQLGALSEGDQGIIAGLQGGDWSSFSNFNDATINQARRNLREKEQFMADELIIRLPPEEIPEYERREIERIESRKAGERNKRKIGEEAEAAAAADEEDADAEID